MTMLYFILLIFLVGAEDYTNPIINEDDPDPGVLKYNNKWWVVTTSGNAADSFPIHVSDDLVHWSLVGHVFPQGKKPAWSVSDYWAPELHAVNDKVLVYFAARNTKGVLCVGVAQASSPSGPFTPNASPLIEDSKYGAIDPTYFEESGHKYLIWKLDGNGASPPVSSIIFAQELQQDGLSLMSGSTPQKLIQNDLPWEGSVVEAPWVFKKGNMFNLFYSGSGFNQPGPYGTCEYAVGVAQSTSLLGPYKKIINPVFSSVYTNPGIPFTGPGHCSVVSWNETTDYIVYHAWRTGKVGGPNPRILMLDIVNWINNELPRPFNGHPSFTPQSVP